MSRRASRLIPFLSLHDPPYIDIPDTLSGASTHAPTKLQSDGQSKNTLDSEHTEALRDNSSKSSTLSPQGTSDASSMSSPRSGKRQRDSTEEPALKRSRLVPIRREARLEARAGQNERSVALPWGKSVLVRLQPAPEQTLKDLRYTLVKLPALDVASCTAAICAKMDIPFVKGMSVSWLDSKTSLRGPFDHAFLRSMIDMQDFVISVTTMGTDGDVGLLMEM